MSTRKSTERLSSSFNAEQKEAVSVVVERFINYPDRHRIVTSLHELSIRDCIRNTEMYKDTEIDQDTADLINLLVDLREAVQQPDTILIPDL